MRKSFSKRSSLRSMNWWTQGSQSNITFLWSLLYSNTSIHHHLCYNHPLKSEQKTDVNSSCWIICQSGMENFFLSSANWKYYWKLLKISFFPGGGENFFLSSANWKYYLKISFFQVEGKTSFCHLQAENVPCWSGGKGRVQLPNRMNFWKNSKRSSFLENYVAIFL